MNKYKVLDTTGHIMARCFSLKEALDFKAAFGNTNWEIKIVSLKKIRNSTEKQRNAVKFVEMWNDVTFRGNINDFYEVSEFLSNYI